VKYIRYTCPECGHGGANRAKESNKRPNPTCDLCSLRGNKIEMIPELKQRVPVVFDDLYPEGA
jgi:transcription elongation factor Elf1